MARLTLEQIDKIALPTKTVEVAAWGGEVEIRALGFDEFTNLRMTLAADDSPEGETAFAIAMLRSGLVDPAIDEAGARALASKSWAAVTELVSEISLLTVGGDSADEAEATFPG